MESHSYTNTATMPSGEYGGDPQDVVGRHLGEESGREGASGYATSIVVCNKNLAIANRSRVSCVHDVDCIYPVTLKSRLRITQGQNGKLLDKSYY